MQLTSTTTQANDTIFKCQLPGIPQGQHELRCIWDAIFAWLSNSLASDLVLVFLFCAGYAIFNPAVLQHAIKICTPRNIRCLGEKDPDKAPTEATEAVPETFHQDDGDEACTSGTRPRCPALTSQTAGQAPELPAGCTTVILRNVPRRCTPDRLLSCVHECGYFGEIDFIYVPIDFTLKKSNLGFAVLNFRSTQSCLKFASEFHMSYVRDKIFDSKHTKMFEVSHALIQGSKVNVRRLQKSPVLTLLKEHPAWLPLAVDAGGLTMPIEAKPTKNPARRQWPPSDMGRQLSS